MRVMTETSYSLDTLVVNEAKLLALVEKVGLLIEVALLLAFELLH